MNTNKRVRIKDYIKDNGLREYFVNRDKMSELYPLLFDTPPEFKFIVGHFMFNFDEIYLRQGLKRPKNFDLLINDIRKLIIEYKKIF